MLGAIENVFLQRYLQYVEDTESPRIFHIWSALAGIAACLGRRNYFDFHINNIYPNLYVVLVGPPAARKNTAINITKRLVKGSTGVRFAPDDTGGQRQGLIKVMFGKDLTEKEHKLLNDAIADAAYAMDTDKIADIELNFDNRDAHVLFAVATELTSLVGTNANELLNFMLKCWDGEDYVYELKSSEITLTDPLLSILAATTTSALASSLPEKAIGQGFTSRVLFVYGAEKYKVIPRPKPLDKQIETWLKERFNKIHYEMDGQFTETEQAAIAMDALYERGVEINDTRFVHYCDRRQDHLRKLTMCLAAGRLSHRIELADVIDAQTILAFTERSMPDALGEYGMSPVAACKQQMLEFIQHVKGPVAKTILWAMMQRDLRNAEFENALAEMVTAKKLDLVHTREHGPSYIHIPATKKLVKEEEANLFVDLLSGDVQPGKKPNGKTHDDVRGSGEDGGGGFGGEDWGEAPKRSIGAD